MRNFANLFRTVLLFSFLFFPILVFGQVDPTLDYDKNTDPLNFNVKIPPIHFQNLKPFVPPTPDSIPYFYAFMIYGDGNYELIDNKMITKADYMHSFSHPYLYDNDYSGFALLQEKKTDDPPPESGLGIFPNDPTGGASLGIIKVRNSSNPSPIDLTLNPPNPIIDAGMSNRVGLDFSHLDNGIFYVEKNKIVAVPIAYKAIEDNFNECLIFYYDDTQNGVDEFTFYQAYKSRYGGSNLPSTPPVPRPSNLPSFEKMIIYDIPFAEGHYQPGLPPSSLTELRWFPLLRSSDNLVARNYRFLAVLYGQGLNLRNYELQDSILATCDPLPEEIEIDGTKYFYQDASLLEAFHTEPDDPNKMVITDICKCDGDEHIVTFNLEFCNQALLGVATGATIVMDDIYNLFSCIEYDELLPDPEENCIENGNCNWCCDSPSDGISSINEDIRYCYRIENESNYLIGANPCGNITFSTRIKTDDLHFLYEKSVFDYCVRLHSRRCDLQDGSQICSSDDATITQDDELYADYLNNHPNNTPEFHYDPLPFNFVKEICGVNCLLDTLLLQSDTVFFPESSGAPAQTISVSRLVPNPIWSGDGTINSGRNKPCEDCKNCCKGPLCNIGRPGPITLALIALSIIGITTLLIRQRAR